MNYKYYAWFCAIIFRALLLLPMPATLQAEKLTLGQALEIAFANSPEIRTTALSLEISEHNLRAQQAALKSQFTLTLTPYSYSKDRIFNSLISAYTTQESKESAAQIRISQPIKWTDATLNLIDNFDWREAASSYTGSIREKTYSNTLFLRLNQPLFTYNRTQTRLEELRLELENAQLAYAIRKLQIESQVTQQFLNLYHDQQSVKISEEEYANASESFDIIDAKVNAGISAPEELYQAELTRADSKAALENSQIRYENGLDNFKIILGLPLEHDLEIVADVKKHLVKVDLAKAVDHGIANRMELRQRDIAIQNALFDLTRTGAQNEFSASVDLTYGLIGTDEEFSKLYDSPTRNQSFAITLNIPLFDWGQKRHQIKASQSALESRELSRSEEEKQVKLQIRQAYRNLQNQKTQIDIAEKNVANARLTYEINLERYRSGDLSSKDISFYQNQLSSQQLNEIAALINYQLALLDLKIQSLWDFEHDRSVLQD